MVDSDLAWLFQLSEMEQAERNMGVARQINQFVDCFELPDNVFKKLFRVNKEIAQELVDTLYPFMVEPSRVSALSVETKIMCALRFFASGSYQQDIGDNRNIALSQASVSRSIHEVTDAVHWSGLFTAKIKFPSNVEDLNGIRQKFFNIYQFPGIVGSVDCTHVAIVAPSENDPVYPEHIYVNRKGYHSINVQLISDANLNILHVNAKYPGSTRDSYIWNNSNTLPAIQQIHRMYPSMYYFVGDSGYALRPWMLTPILNAPANSPESRYNDHQMAARSTVERLNGVLKMRFRSLLKHRVLHYSPTVASKIINTCCTLHNMCVSSNLEEPDNTEDMLGDEIFNSGSEDGNQISGSNTLLTQGRALQNRIVRSYFSSN